MNLLDLLILFVLVTSAIRWAAYGFSRGALSLFGFWLGIFVGAVIAPFIIRLFDDSSAKFIAAMTTVFFSGFVIGSLGKLLGLKLYDVLYKFRLRRLDAILGATFSAVVTLVSFWLLASLVNGTPFRDLNRLVQESRVVQAMNNTLPPAPTVLSRLATLVGPYDFPQVFIGREPRPIRPVTPPSSAEIAAAIEAAGRSTVRIESLACRGQLFGSGFVAADGIVMTNAHVVAGADRPKVVDEAGEHPAEVIYFDPEMDLAVLRTTGLAGPVLPIAEQGVDAGTNGTTLGYPGGGPLEADAASVLEEITARGRNIYGRGVTDRPVYVLQTAVKSGNSGGPVVLPDGRVIGVIFAQSVSYPDVGYAITSEEALKHLRQALANNRAVDTGPCVSE